MIANGFEKNDCVPQSVFPFSSLSNIDFIAECTNQHNNTANISYLNSECDYDDLPELFKNLEKKQWSSSVVEDIIQAYKMI